MDLTRRVIARVALLLPFAVLLSLLLYPIYRHLYAGLALVLAGGIVAFLPSIPALRNLAVRTGRIQPAHWLIALTLLGILIRIPLILFARNPESDFLTYLQTAQKIASGLGFGDYLFYPPGQSAFLSIWIWLFGSNVHILIAIECFVSIATICISYAAFARYSRSAAMWTSAMVALYPAIVIWSGTLGHETLVMLLSSVIFWLLSKASEHMSLPWWILCGVTTGVASLVRPTFIAAPILMFVCFWLCGHSFTRSAAAGAVITLSCLLAIAPWTWRNYQHFHRFALISTNFGVTLLSSNHPDSDGIWMETMGIGRGLDPVSQDKLQTRMALQSISSNPGVFAIRTFKRIVYMWGAETSIPDGAFGTAEDMNQKIRLVLRLLVQFFWCAFVMAWCLGGLKLDLSWNPQEAPAVWALLWVCFVFCIHAVLEPAARHHMALLPMIAGIYMPAYGAWLTSATRQREALQHSS